MLVYINSAIIHRPRYLLDISLQVSERVIKFNGLFGTAHISLQDFSYHSTL